MIITMVTAGITNYQLSYVCVQIVHLTYSSTDITDGACEADNMTYYDGEVFVMDLCTTCQCNNATINCTTEICPECEQGTSPFIVPNRCCPECRLGK